MPQENLHAKRAELALLSSGGGSGLESTLSGKTIHADSAHGGLCRRKTSPTVCRKLFASTHHRLRQREMVSGATQRAQPMFANALGAEIVPYAADDLELVRDLQFHQAGVQLLTPFKQAVLTADDDLDRQSSAKVIGVGAEHGRRAVFGEERLVAVESCPATLAIRPAAGGPRK